MRRYDAVIFDLDGTLLDTGEGVSKSVRYTIDKLGLPEASEGVLRSFIGPPIQRSFERIYGLDKTAAMEAADIFRSRYKDEDLLLAIPYEGIFETIDKLSAAGIRTGVATYKRQDYADKILSHFGFDRVCDVICGSDAEGKLSKCDIIENAIRMLGVTDKSRAVMIGDSDNDAEGAAQIGVPFVGVTYGFGFASKEDVDVFTNIGTADSCPDILRCIL